MKLLRLLTLCVGILLAVTGPGASCADATERPVGVGQPAPEITGGPWINSEPLSLGGLRGRVVLVEFWTYG
jgi:hypothetical protein